MVTVKFWIEGNAIGHQTYHDELEVDDEYLDGLTLSERQKAIEEIVADAVANVVQWGFEEC